MYLHLMMGQPPHQDFWPIPYPLPRELICWFILQSELELFFSWRFNWIFNETFKMDSALHCLELISAHCLKLLNLEKLRKGPPACVWWFWYTVYLQNFHCQQWDNHYINEKKHAAGGAAPPSMALGSTTCGFTRRVGALGGVGDVVVQAAWEVG